MSSATRLLLAQDSVGPWRRRPRSSFRLGYRPALDGLRGLAIIAVLGFDLGLPGFSGGHVGVDLFFVLSGFLITSLLIEEWERHGSVDLASFYVRRSVRILPPLLLVLATCLALSIFARYRDIPGGSDTDADALSRGAIATLLYAGNWARAFGLDLGSLGHTWSLGIQEQFYLLWPPILVWLLARVTGRGRLALMLLVACIVVAVARYVVYTSLGWEQAYFGLETRADALLMGCIVACLASGGMLPTRGWRLGGLRLLALGGLLALVAVRQVENRLLYLGVYSAVEVSAALVVAGVVATATGWAQRALSLQPLVWLGRISYALYLWHYPVAEVIGVSDTTGRIATIATSLILATATYLAAERSLLPIRARLRRVPGDKTSASLPLILSQPLIDRRLPPPLPAFTTAALAEPIDQPQALPAPQPGAPTTRPTQRIEAYQG